MSSTKKRKCCSISLKDKVAIISELEAGKKQIQVAAERNIAKTTVQSIWSNKAKHLKDYECYSPGAKRVRKSDFPKTDEALLKWFDALRERNIPVNGPLLLEQARKFAGEFGEDDFLGSCGWLDKWKKRHNVKFYAMAGEAAAANDEAIHHWLENVWPNIIKQYSTANIFSCDETALFFKLSPNKTMSRKGRTCTNGELSKERLTVLLACNADGTEKLKPLVIGKSENPRCFKYVKKTSLPVDYYANQNAWMTTLIFEAWLKKLDCRMRLQGRQIILLLDNCGPHTVTVELSNVSLEFLPVNSTSKLLPLDQGIIKNFKYNYRKRLLQQCINDHKNVDELKVDVLDAVMKTAEAWNNVKGNHIAACFLHSKIIHQDVEMVGKDEDQEDDNFKEAFLDTVDCDPETYFTIDDQVATHCVSTAREIAEDILEQSVAVDNDTDGEDDPDMQRTVIGYDEATQCIEDLKLWFLSLEQDDAAETALISLFTVQAMMDKCHQTCARQGTLDCFVKLT